LISEEFIKVGGHRIHYRTGGSPARGTLLGLHGGPGGSYDYLYPLFDLASDQTRVVLFDQSGGGKSDVPKDRSMFTVEHFVEEVEGVRKLLDLGKVHLYGHSWGGMLAQAYAIKHQTKLRSLILSGTCSSIPMLESEMELVFQGLSPKARKAITEHEALGEFEAPEYISAVDEFNSRHQVLVNPWPETLKFVFEHFGKAVGETMFGPYLVKVTGNMKYWDVTEQLKSLRIPTLIICGEQDFLTPKLHKIIHAKIKGSKLVILSGASHASMWERREAYNGAIREFLDSLSNQN